MSACSPEELSGPELLRQVMVEDLRGDIETLQRDIGLYTRLKDEATLPEDRELLAGLIMDTLTVLNHYYQEIGE